MTTDLPNAWAALLGSIVPEQRSVGLLQAMLWDGAAARARWAAWAQTVGDPRKFFEKDYWGRKGLLAFLSHRLSANGIDAGRDFATYARVAQVREELRSRIFIDTLQAVQSAMDAARLEPIVVNGAAYAFTVYAEPLVRHNHGIDLLLPARMIEEAGRVTAEVGFRHERTTALPRGVVKNYRHRTGLELTLRSRLYLTPHVKAEPSDVRTRCEEVLVETFRVRVLAPADRLCHTLGEGGTAATSRNLRWACDAYLLLRRAAPLDYDRVIAAAVEVGTALPVAVLLEFFRTELDVAVPAEVIAELRRRSGAPRAVEHASMLLSMALRTSESVDEFVGRARRQPALFRAAARFALFPSAEHMAYQRRPTAAWRIPWLYVERMGRLLARPLRRRQALRGVVS
jgi:hypothetical protein